MPLVVPLSTVTVFSKLDDPLSMTGHRHGGDGPDERQVLRPRTCWAADCSAGAWIDCACRPATCSRRRWFSCRSDP